MRGEGILVDDVVRGAMHDERNFLGRVRFNKTVENKVANGTTGAVMWGMLFRDSRVEMASVYTLEHGR